MLEYSRKAGQLARAALREAMLSPLERGRGPLLDRREIEGLIPHRGSLLLLDGVTCVDRDRGIIVCRYDLGRAAAIFENHFPGRPVWPGVLQVEAIGQAGLCLLRLMGVASPPDFANDGFALTQIVTAHFLRPVTPGKELEIVSRAVPDGLFNILVGQCLQHDRVCSMAVVRGINTETDT
jgi:3-hydroxyacyl-[acyl-carrier-protein] dehydratase